MASPISNTLSKFSRPWLPPRAWLNDLSDPRVRSEVIKALYVDNVITLLIHITVSLVFIWVHDFVRGNLWICAILVIWCGFAILSYLKEVQLKSTSRKADPTPEQSWHYLLVYVLSSLSQTACLSIILVFFLAHDDQGIKSYEVIGILFYYFGSIIKDFSVRLLSIAYTTMLLVPMTAFHFLLGTATGFIVGAFVLVFIFGVIGFAGSMSRTVISQIQQRYKLEELTAKLTVERDRADAANAAKSRFFTSASHDARQPLQAIALLHDSIANSATMSLADRNVIDKIGANLQSIRNLFNQVLDISRIETGSVAPQYQDVPLQNLFNILDAQMGELAASKNLWLRFVPTQVVLWHDPQLLERMVGNLIHNALKFTHQGGVWVAYRTSRGVLEIRDSGVGIAHDKQQLIFEEFYQLDNTARRRDDDAGLGLGLSIVKRLAALTDTQVGLRSLPNQGSTFWLKLRLAKPQPSTTLQIAKQDYGQLPRDILANQSLLLVEDDAELCALFTQRLHAYGAQVTACNNVQQATSSMQRMRFDAVITDYRLGSNASGIDVVHSARQHLAQTAPVIVITGDTSSPELHAIGEMPHVWVLHKPVSFDQLLSILAK